MAKILTFLEYKDLNVNKKPITEYNWFFEDKIELF